MKYIYLLLIYFSCCFSYAQAPVFQWVNQIRGYQSFSFAKSITTDASGNAYVIGSFTGTSDFNPNTDIYELNTNGSRDMFIVKYDVNGNLIWPKNVGGDQYVSGRKIILDQTGNIYVIGYFNGYAYFNSYNNTSLMSSLGEYDAFILKLSNNGNFLWAKSFGGIDEDFANNIVIDPSQNVIISGIYKGQVDFDPGPATYTLQSNGASDIFMLKLNSSGNFVWAKSIGGAYDDSATGLQIDGSGNIYSTGSYQGIVDFDPGLAINTLTNNSAFSATYILKLDVNGDFAWVKSIAGSGNCYGSEMALDNFGNICICGYFDGTADFNPNEGIYNLTAVKNSYILKLNPEGNFVWVKNFAAILNNIITDASGDIYSSGEFSSNNIDFDPGPSTFTLKYVDNVDFALLKLNGNGDFLWAAAGGGISNDYCTSIALDPENNIYLTGIWYYHTCDFDPSENTYELIAETAPNAFTLKLKQVPVGINTISLNNNPASIYPNPTNGNFTIELNNYSDISIYNSTGQLIYHKKSDQLKSEICLSEFANGIYFLRSGNYIQKIIKE